MEDLLQHDVTRANLWSNPVRAPAAISYNMCEHLCISLIPDGLILVPPL